MIVQQALTKLEYFMHCILVQISGSRRKHRILDVNPGRLYAVSKRRFVMLMSGLVQTDDGCHHDDNMLMTRPAGPGIVPRNFV